MGHFKSINDVDVESVNLNTFLLKKNLLKWLLILKQSPCIHLKEMDITEWMKKTVAKCPKFCATIEPILLAFPSLLNVDLTIYNLHYLLSKLRITLTREHGDLQLKLTNL